MNAVSRIRGGFGTALLGVCTLLATRATAQDPQIQAELKRWHGKIADPYKAVSVEDARQAQAKLKEWNLSADKLAVEPRGQFLRLEIYTALALGDVARAAERLPELELDFPNAPETAQAAYLVAGAAGDAERATQKLEKLRELKAEGGKLLSTRSRQLRMVGQLAPSMDVKTEDGQTFPLRHRTGVALVLDFWSLRQKPTDEQLRALSGLREEVAADSKVRFLGINSDAPAQVAAAQKFANENGLVWPQHFERKLTNPPLTQEAFHCGPPPWQIVIDGRGYIRAVGSADEPALHYALRAVAAETNGTYKALNPKTSTGEMIALPPEPKEDKPAQPPAAKPDQPGKPDQPKPGEKPQVKPKENQPQGELPSNDEARALLDRARLYLKTGKKTEAKQILHQIIDKYPGTREAKEAKELLQYYP